MLALRLALIEPPWLSRCFLAPPLFCTGLPRMSLMISSRSASLIFTVVK